MSSASVPWGLRWRASTAFIISTVAVGLFTDLFLYGLIVPILPFMLVDRIHLPENQVQGYVSALLAAYAGASVFFSVPAGIIADKAKTRSIPFLSALAALLASTIMLALGQSIPVLVLGRVLQGTSAAVVWTVGLAMILDTVGPGNLGKTIGSIFSVITVGDLIAPVLGGVLYEKTGYGGVFGLGAGILVVDFIMRVLVIEKKVAVQYNASANGLETQHHRTENSNVESVERESEEDLLLPKKLDEEFKIPNNQNILVRKLPVLYCLSNPRVATALWLIFVQAGLLGVFDATVPLEGHSLFGFSSLDAGLLFIGLNVPVLILGPLAGWAVDKYGPKPAAVLGFTFLVPVLILLRLPQQGGKDQIILFCSILTLCGVGLGVLSSPSFVEASIMVQKYNEANPEFFGEQGPYAQLYGFTSLIWNTGLTVGPIVGGTLRDRIGYGNMNLAVAAISGLTALLSYVYIGGIPKILQKG